MTYESIFVKYGSRINKWLRGKCCVLYFIMSFGRMVMHKWAFDNSYAMVMYICIMSIEDFCNAIQCEVMQIEVMPELRQLRLGGDI